MSLKRLTALLKASLLHVCASLCALGVLGAVGGLSEGCACVFLRQSRTLVIVEVVYRCSLLPVATQDIFLYLSQYFTVMHSDNWPIQYCNTKNTCFHMLHSVNALYMLLK